MKALFPEASRIGFGCASLGSRVGSRQGLSALARAFEQGVNWFDVAPSYGDGRAEKILGEFVRSRRDRLHILTKCGLAPPRLSPAAPLLRPLARTALSLAPSLRKTVGRAREAAQRLPLTPEAIDASLDASLRRLGVDQVDVLALHDPSPADLASSDVAEALHAVLASGRAKVVGVAGSLEAVLLAAEGGLPIRCLQFPFTAGSDAVREVRTRLGERADQTLLVTHSVLKSAASGLARDDERKARLIDDALADNPDGVVLMSMFDPAHLAFNLSRLGSESVLSGAQLE